jgi:hypothetical protein
MQKSDICLAWSGNIKVPLCRTSKDSCLQFCEGLPSEVKAWIPFTMHMLILLFCVPGQDPLMTIQNTWSTALQMKDHVTVFGVGRWTLTRLTTCFRTWIAHGEQSATLHTPDVSQTTNKQPTSQYTTYQNVLEDWEVNNSKSDVSISFNYKIAYFLVPN